MTQNQKHVNGNVNDFRGITNAIKLALANLSKKELEEFKKEKVFFGKSVLKAEEKAGKQYSLVKGELTSASETAFREFECSSAVVKYCQEMIDVGITTKPEAEKVADDVVKKYNFILTEKQMAGFIKECENILREYHFDFLNNQNREWARKACKHLIVRGDVPGARKLSEYVNETRNLNLSDAALGHLRRLCYEVIGEMKDSEREIRNKAYKAMAEKVVAKMVEEKETDIPGCYPLSRKINEDEGLNLNDFFLKILRSQCWDVLKSYEKIMKEVRLEAMADKIEENANRNTDMAAKLKAAWDKKAGRNKRKAS